MESLATIGTTTLARTRRDRAPRRAPVPSAPWTVGSHAGTPAAAQGGFFDALGPAVPGLLGAASSVLGGGGALGQVQDAGAAAAPGLVQQGVSMLGGTVGGTAGQAVSSLGGAAAQGVGSVLAGEQSAGQAAGGLAQSAGPGILELLMSLLQR